MPNSGEIKTKLNDIVKDKKRELEEDYGKSMDKI